MPHSQYYIFTKAKHFLETNIKLKNQLFEFFKYPLRSSKKVKNLAIFNHFNRKEINVYL